MQAPFPENKFSVVSFPVFPNLYIQIQGRYERMIHKQIGHEMALSVQFQRRNLEENNLNLSLSLYPIGILKL